jgi:outer membrane autotransporter protein
MSVLALPSGDKDGKPQTGGGAAADTPDPFQRWSGFINGDVDIAHQSTSDTQTGFKVDSKGITLGADYRFAGNSVAGASVGFLHADTDLDAGAGTQSARGYNFSLYGTYVPTQNAYIDGIVNLGHNKYSSQRLSPAGSFDSSTTGDQWGVSLSAGYEFNRGPLAFTPYARVEYVDAKVNGFNESGDADNALIIGDQRVKATTLSVGGSASYAFSTSWGVLIPNGHLEFQHLAQSDASDVSAQIVSAVTSTPTQIQVLGGDKTFGNFAVGLSALFGHGVSAFFNYHQLFGKSNVSDRLYTLGLRLEF